MSPATLPDHITGLLANGAWSAPASGRSLDVVAPAEGRLLGIVKLL